MSRLHYDTHQRSSTRTHQRSSLMTCPPNSPSHPTDSFLIFTPPNLVMVVLFHMNLTGVNDFSYQSKDSGRWNGSKVTTRTPWISGTVFTSPPPLLNGETEAIMPGRIIAKFVNFTRRYTTNNTCIRSI